MATDSILSRWAVVLLIAGSTCAASPTDAQESGRRDEFVSRSVDRGFLVVLGFGHLLSHRPNTDEWNDDSPTHQVSGPFTRSLMLIIGLSSVDLVWTLLVSQAGAMRELNPIGNRMIGNPLQLVAFKVLMTTAAVGLLYSCRRVPLARQASWWSCLVLTLVAARWLVFNSMFIS